MDSVINQTIGINNIQIIVIDDVSCDSTLDILEEYRVKYPNNICIITRKVNSTKAKEANRNIAMAYATGDYVLFLDQDDWYEINAFEILMEYASKYPELDYIEYNFRCIDEKNNTCEIKQVKERGFNIYTFSTEEERNYYAKIKILPGATYAWNKLYRKKYLIENSIYHNDGSKKSGFGDNFFSGLLVLACHSIGKLDVCLYNYLNHSGSYSHDKSENSSVQFERCKAGIFFYEECKTRGYLQKNPEMVEYIFCRTFLLKTFWKFLMQCDPIPFNKLEFIQKEMLQRFPNYRDNKIMRDIKEIDYLFNILDQTWTTDYLIRLHHMIEKEMEQSDVKKYMYLT